MANTVLQPHMLICVLEIYLPTSFIKNILLYISYYGRRVLWQSFDVPVETISMEGDYPVLCAWISAGTFLCYGTDFVLQKNTPLFKKRSICEKLFTSFGICGSRKSVGGLL